jgi:hypothetical protein
MHTYPAEHQEHQKLSSSIFFKIAYLANIICPLFATQNLSEKSQCLDIIHAIICYYAYSELLMTDNNFTSHFMPDKAYHN